MKLQRIGVKLFTIAAGEPPLAAFIDVFHTWIQESAGVYHDIADYSHMRWGPGIVLVANNANVSVDESGGRRGLLYQQKTALEGSNREKLTRVVRSAVENCLRLERDPALAGKVKFAGDELLIIVNDRLLAPNGNNSSGLIKPEIEETARSLFGSAALRYERDTEGRKRFNLRVKASHSYSLDQLLRNLQRS